MGRERRATLCGENPPSIHACLTPGLSVKLVSGMGEGWEISYIRYGRSYFSLWYRRYFGCISSNQFSTFKNLWAYMSWPHVFAWCGTYELIETKITMLSKSISRWNLITCDISSRVLSEWYKCYIPVPHTPVLKTVGPFIIEYTTGQKTILINWLRYQFELEHISSRDSQL